MGILSTYREAFILPSSGTGPSIQIRSVSIPALAPNQVLTKAIYAGINNQDQRRANRYHSHDSYLPNQGSDVAGIVVSVGSRVKNFRRGDRVAAMRAGANFAEYAVSYDFATIHIPDQLDFAEAATLPVAFHTAATALYRVLRLPMPIAPLPSDQKQAIVVYGASSCVGIAMLQLASLSNLHPIIAIADGSTADILSLLDLSRGDVILDSGDGEEVITKGAQVALARAKIAKVGFAVDCVSVRESLRIVQGILLNSIGISSATAKIACMRQPPQDMKFARSVTAKVVSSNAVFTPNGSDSDQEDFDDGSEGFFLEETEFEAAMFRVMERGLEAGWLKTLPYKILEQHRERQWWHTVEDGLRRLKDGDWRDEKFVVKMGSIM